MPKDKAKRQKRKSMCCHCIRIVLSGVESCFSSENGDKDGRKTTVLFSILMACQSEGYPIFTPKGAEDQQPRQNHLLKTIQSNIPVIKSQGQAEALNRKLLGSVKEGSIF
jgi:hypothetical protein